MTSDLALKGVGLACAAGSVWFAAYMVNHQGEAPRVNAMEEFALFAQPNRVRAVEAALRGAPAQSDPKRTGKVLEIDMTPIGATQIRAPAKAETARRDLRIVELNPDSALLETSEGYRRIRVGDDMPEIGKIIAIRRMAEYWIVVASVRSLAQAAPPDAK
ncbi:hypothetical protein M2323_002517 [Rhodoblastus acidophilus]|uniref:hypothetical protein n=1 Tax=Rhodoblastus acidophilus TaxID=1074 RepID=UPI0022240E97|nr:hypothetical protein [Rhodoblastus acidophilus]MCW2284630.1 hypothetical protein [Rhodoblastus acidophilus]MCW2333583.1 hypothetical protein [Rhodoblastus acidophilus]